MLKFIKNNCYKINYLITNVQISMDQLKKRVEGLKHLVLLSMFAKYEINIVNNRYTFIILFHFSFIYYYCELVLNVCNLCATAIKDWHLHFHYFIFFLRDDLCVLWILSSIIPLLFMHCIYLLSYYIIVTAKWSINELESELLRWWRIVNVVKLSMN